MWLYLVLLAALKWAVVIGIVCAWNWVRTAWWMALAWYYKIDDYRDLPYTPIPIETVEYPELNCILTSYTIRSFPDRVFALAQPPDQNLLPTAATIRELVATKSDDDLGAIEVEFAMVDVDHMQCSLINVTDALRSLMGPCNAHVDPAYACSQHVRFLSTDALLYLLVSYWTGGDAIDTDAFSIAVRLKHPSSNRMKQFVSLAFMRDFESYARNLLQQ